MIILDSYGRICSDRSLEEALQELVKSKETVRVLDLSDWEMSELPEILLQFENLQELYLDRNGLEELPEWIGDFKHLSLLSLGRNELKELPKSIFNLSDCLEKLFLGHNQISELPFIEYEMAVFKQGSIGRNPIREMISRRWMLWEDFIQFPAQIQQLVPANLPPEFEKMFSEQAARIIIDCQEPMVYEILLAGVKREGEEIIWSEYFQRPCFQWIGEQIIDNIPRGTIVDDSLQCFILQKYFF